MLNETEQQLIELTQSRVAERMQGQQAGHGIDHVLRVLRTAREIQSEVGGNRLVVELASLLHDVGDAKFHQGVERSGEFARVILAELHVADEVIEQVVHIVDNLSFRKRGDAQELTLEGKIVQDADRLDALGAIGIVRTIEYGAAFDQPFHVANADHSDGEPMKTGIGHFHEKLFKLHGLLNTDPARRMADQRVKFMREFVEQFLREWDGVGQRSRNTDLH